MADWDDDDDERDELPDDDGEWSLDPTEETETPEIPQTWDEWWDFDWESYDGDYEEYAVSADYNGE